MFKKSLKTEKVVMQSDNGYGMLISAVILKAIDDYVEARNKKQKLQDNYVDSVHKIMKNKKTNGKEFTREEAEKEYEIKIGRCDKVMNEVIRFFKSDYFDFMSDTPAEVFVSRLEEIAEDKRNDTKKRRPPLNPSCSSWL
jgi:hypothetical protein